MIHTVKGFSVVNEAEVDVFLEFPCFLYDLINVCNLISGSSDFSKFSLHIWKFLVHILLKPSLKDFEYNLASMWNEQNCTVVWTFFGIALLWDSDEIDLFQSCSQCWVFQICWHIEWHSYSTLFLWGRKQDSERWNSLRKTIWQWWGKPVWTVRFPWSLRHTLPPQLFAMSEILPSKLKAPRGQGLPHQHLLKFHNIWHRNC